MARVLRAAFRAEFETSKKDNREIKASLDAPVKRRMQWQKLKSVECVVM